MDQFAAEHGSVTVAGAILRYLVEGDGIPVLVVGSATYYPRTFSRRLREVCRLAFADLRHFAESDGTPGPDRITFETYADDIEAIREAVGFRRAVVVGHSKHGNLALEYAKRYPERASGVVLVGSLPVGVSRVVEARERYWTAHASEDRKAALRRTWEALGPDTLASLPPDQALVARYITDGPKYWYDPGYDASPLWRDVRVNMGALDAVHDLFAGYDLSWDPQRLRAPVLVVAGRHDYVVPHGLWDGVLPGLENVTYRLFERSGHTPQLEEQDRFDRELLEWLGSCNGSDGRHLRARVGGGDRKRPPGSANT